MKILVAEDDLTSRTILVAMLRKNGYCVEMTDNGVTALAIMTSTESPPLAILDWLMPGMDGIDVCTAIRNHDTTLPPYIIMLTSLGDEEHLVEGLTKGANDYLAKPFKPGELFARLRVAERVIRLQERLAFQASTDPLTGLANRAELGRVLRRELARAAMDGSFVALGMLDIDFFKKVNDTYGHAVGDEVLAGFARRCEAVLQVYDTIGRMGGEEFLVIVPGCEPEGTFWERLRLAVFSKPFPTMAGPVTISTSIGVACGPGTIDPETLLRHADAALYRAKAAGRNCVSRCCVDNESKKPACTCDSLC